MKRQKNPCIDACDFSHNKGWCNGCARTKEECKKWQSMKPYDKNILQKALQKRLNLMTKQRKNNE